MESRLLFLAAFNRFEAPRVQPATAERLSGLSGGMEQLWVREAEEYARNPEAGIREMARQAGPEMIARMRENADMYRAPLEESRGRLAALSLSAESHQMLEEIFEAVAHIPALEEFAGDPPARHRYLHPRGYRINGKDSENLVYFQTDFRTIETDLQRIGELRQLFPDASQDLTVLEEGLRGFMRADRRVAGYEYEKGNQSVTTEVFKQFGTTAAVAALLLTAVLMGAVGIFGKRKDLIGKALVPLAVAALLFPGVRNMLLGGKLDRDIASLRKSLSDPVIDLMAAYDVRGAHWANLADRIRDRENPDVQSTIRKLEDSAQRRALDEGEFQALVEELMPGNDLSAREARENFVRMVKDNQFADFTRAMRAPRADQTWDTVRGFVLAGSAPAAQALRALEAGRDAQHAAEEPRAATDTPPTSPPVS